MFPLGDYLKTNVKEIAREIGLHQIAQKKESMGICFVGEREFPDFISEVKKKKKMSSNIFVCVVNNFYTLSFVSIIIILVTVYR